jgi:hypothetical protein
VPLRPTLESHTQEISRDEVIATVNIEGLYPPELETTVIPVSSHASCSCPRPDSRVKIDPNSDRATRVTTLIATLIYPRVRVPVVAAAGAVCPHSITAGSIERGNCQYLRFHRNEAVHTG